MAASSSVPHIILSRYAGALVDLAEQKKSVDVVLSDLRALRSALGSSDELSMIVRSPMIGKAMKTSVLMDIAKKAKFNVLTVNFLGVLVQNRRIDALPEMIDHIEKVISGRSGAQAISVVVAVEMTAAQKTDLQTKIASSLGHDISLQVKVDQAILGGMIVTIGSKMIDDSVRRKLERLNAALTRDANNSNQTLKEVV